MVNETNLTNLTEIVDAMDLNKGANYLTFLSESITGEIVNFLATKGINVSVRWVSLLVLVVCLGLIWIAVKISKPVIKWILIGLSILLILGLVIPSW